MLGFEKLQPLCGTSGRQMCVFVSRPMKLPLFFGKNGDPPKRVVDFLRGRDTSRKKIMEIVKDFDEKKLQQQRQTLEIVEDFECEAKFLLFLIFHFLFIFCVGC